MINKNEKGKRTSNKLAFKFNHKTVLDIRENKSKDTHKGQKEVWTAKKGVVKIWNLFN